MAVLIAQIPLLGALIRDAKARGTWWSAAGWNLGVLLLAPLVGPLYVHAASASSARRAVHPLARLWIYVLSSVWIGAVAALSFATVMLAGAYKMPRPGDSPGLMDLVGNTACAAILIAWTFVARSLLDSRRPSSLGTSLSPLRSAALEHAVGLGAGAALAACACLLTVALGAARVDASAGGADRLPLLLSLPVLYVAAFWEELTFRGYAQANVQEAWGRAAAVALPSLVFGCIHAANPDATAIGLLNVALFGVLLALTVVRTGRLWAAIGLHFAWNLTTGPILGWPVSGVAFGGWLAVTPTGPPWLSGGGFGLEGSVVTTALLAVAIALLLTAQRRRPARADQISNTS